MDKPKATAQGLIDHMFQDREDILAMWAEVKPRYQEAPASGYKDWHGAFKGGLEMHSVSVAMLGVKIADTLECSDLVKSVVFVGLFHDLGKIGDHEKPYYVPETENWWREKRGRYYRTNEDLPYVPHSNRSLYLLQYYGVYLTSDEHTAITYHDGQYVPRGKEIEHNEPKLALIIHWADYWSTHVLKI